ncbi:unnamed protein product [Diatraea saccharalis]|uniref:Uncharacterized protein n=1 Tax=Diatraea saccharalis TaxID=40085 RepID=A0A9N9N1Q0_9NEOP|nr:unnamed protein product [Diatraea saccharalis]
MPLTGAEKTRRYREKLKNERPDEYAAQCKRNLDRLKSKKKKNTEMSSEEAELQRKKWREEKRKHCAKIKKIKSITKCTNEPENPIDGSDLITLNRFRRKCRFLLKKCRYLQQCTDKLKTQKEKYKKRLYRLKIKDMKEINDLNLTITKMRAREEVLESTLQKTYRGTKSQNDKKILKKIVDNSTNKTVVTKMLGLIGKARVQKRKRNQINVYEITQFYLRDDVSRITSGRKETRTQHKEKKQIRYLMDTLVESYKKYKDGGGRYGLTSFFNHKPFYVLSPHLNARDTCLCIKHSNLEFLHSAIRRCGALKMGMRQVLSNVACDTKSYTCMYDKCESCKDKKLNFESSENSKTDDSNIVSWLRWERQDHTYSKKEGIETKQIKTKRTKKITKSGTLEDLKKFFNEELHNFKKHYYNMQQQQSQYRKAISQLKDNEVVLVCDFSESYEAKLASEIQAMHFGASKHQITLHTGMVYWHNKSQSFCTLAESNNHQPPAIWAHLTPIIQLIKEETPNLDVIHFFTDGPSSQYRQKNNFFLFAYFAKKLQLNFATWSFFESGHGKSVADGIGGSVKRTLDRKVCQGVDVTDAKDAYDILKQCLKVTKVFLVPDSAITAITHILPRNIQPLKGTLQVHQIMTHDENIIKFRDVSCFCEPLRGRCACFQPQIHSVVSKTNRGGDRIQRVQSLAKPPELAQPECQVFDDISLQHVNNQIKHKGIIDSLEGGSLDSALPDLVGTFDISDMESLKSLDVNINNSEGPVELMDINVMPIIFAPVPKSTVRQTPGKENKTIKKTFTICQKCKASVVGRKANCMSCKKNYCEECTAGPQKWDYLCDICLEGGSLAGVILYVIIFIVLVYVLN